MSNDAQARHWNEVAGPLWVERQRVFDRMLEPCQRLVLAALAPRLGETILDVGCGFGTTSIATAAGIGSNGRVHGVDISAPMIERAISRVSGSPLNMSFGVLDAQTNTLHGPYDAAVSRFGVMFFDDPVAAFANIGGALRRGGRLAFVCWQPLSLNPYFQMAGRYLVPLLTTPPAPPIPFAPGPFAFADPDRTAGLLVDAGWSDIVIQPGEPTLRFDLDGDDGIDNAIEFMVDSEMGRLATAQAGPETVEQALVAVRAELRSGLVDGVLQFPAAVWIVTARFGG